MNLQKILNLKDSSYSIRQITAWLWAVMRGNRLQASLNALLGIVNVAVSLASVWAMQRAIDIAAHAQGGSLLWAVAVMGGLILCEFGIGMSRTWIKNILGVRAQNRLQQQMLDRLLRAEWRGRDSRHSGDIVNRLESDVHTVIAFVTETLPNTLSVVAMFIGAFVYLMQMDTWLAIITVAILPLFLLVSRFYISRMRHFTRQVRNSDSQIQSLLTETLQHQTLIKTLEAGGEVLSRLDNTQSELRQHVRRRTVFSLLSNLAINAGFSIGYLIAFLWGAMRLYNGTITFGQMSAFLQLVYRIQGPARDLTRLAPAFVSVFTAAERLMELEETPQEQQGDDLLLQEPCGIELRNVSYRYPGDDQDVVSRLSYSFAPGTCTAVLGETGVGKTTLIRLILALIKPTEGQVLIRSAHSGSAGISPLHRCNFVYVPQGNTLLSGTIRQNLLIGKPTATEEQMMEALHTACADFVERLPKGLDTQCSERGGGLSEGQAQRIAIARALLRDRSIMLFDEATSALDPETERLLLQNILADRRKTVIFITHRPAVVDYCDQTLSFANG